MHGDAGVNPFRAVVSLALLLFSQVLDVALQRELVKASNSDHCRIQSFASMNWLP
jgi:hypothetical protein